MPTKVADRLNHAAGCSLKLVTYSTRLVAVPKLEPFTAREMAAALDTAEVDALAASKPDLKVRLACVLHTCLGVSCQQPKRAGTGSLHSHCWSEIKTLPTPTLWQKLSEPTNRSPC